MAKRTDITTGLQAVSAAGAVTGTLDTSAITGDFTIKGRVTKLGAGKRMLLAVEDTANSTPFSDARPMFAKHFLGEIKPETEVQFSIRSFELPMLRYGASNCKLRLNVIAADSTPAGEVELWLEQ